MFFFARSQRRSPSEGVAIAALLAVVFSGALFFAGPSAAADDQICQGCTICHNLVEPVMAKDRNMMRALADMDLTRTGGCTSCHGGDAHAKELENAHSGGPGFGLLSWFSARPTTAGAVDKACGTCHKDKVIAVRNSRMNGRPQTVQMLMDGSAVYKQRFAAQVDKAKPAITCRDSCHIWPDKVGKGDPTGCAICHFPASADRWYKGPDVNLRTQLKQKKKYQSAEHTMLGTTKAASLLHGKPGVPLESCLECHQGGKGVALRFAGRSIKGEPKRNGKTYPGPVSDVHFQKGLQCQDCHTALGTHGDGSYRAQGRQTEIECSDCHGTSTTLPWNLPLEYGDKPGAFGDGRGTAAHLLPTQLHGSQVDAPQGYLLTTRGNPVGNVIRSGSKAILYSVSGVTHTVPLLSDLPQDRGHRDPAILLHESRKMECYACHSVLLMKRGFRKDKVVAGASVKYDGILADNTDQMKAPLLSTSYRKRKNEPTPATPHDVIKTSPDCKVCHPSGQDLTVKTPY